MHETAITVSGNLVTDPDLGHTQEGVAVARFRVASTSRYRNSQGQWADGETLFITCTAWRGLAESLVNAQLKKGALVIVVGRLRQTSYQGSDGSAVTAFEITVTDMGESVRAAARQEVSADTA